MSYNILTTPDFEKELRQLSRKYPSLKKDFSELVLTLKDNPVQGDALGKSCYKIRLAIKSKGKGKRGGARVITYVAIVHETVYLLSIYDKSEKESITDGELKTLLDKLPGN